MTHTRNPVGSLPRPRSFVATLFCGSTLLLSLAGPATELRASGEAFDLPSIETRVQGAVSSTYDATVCLTVSGGRGAGSGVIVSEDGLVLTAAHVVPKVGESIQIILSSGQVLPGKSLGALRNRDAGMAQITEEGSWPHAEVAEADCEPGQWVYALGHSGGFQIDRGAPLRLGRVLRADTFLQTDCFVTGGDSGGPLFDLSGRVVGIHSSIGGSTDQNLHVPISVYLKNWERLKKGDEWGNRGGMRLPVDMVGPSQGGATRPYLGISFADGLTVKSVEPGEAAEFAGIEPGDVLVEFAGRSLSGLGDFALRLAACRPRERVRVTVRREGRVRRLSTTLGARGQDSKFLTYQRDHISVLRSYPEPVRGLERSVVRLRSGADLAAYGTVISPQGHAVTKASEVKGRELRCELPDGTEAKATVVQTVDELDLAIVRVESTNLVPVTWAEADPELGTLVCSALGNLPTELVPGVVSVPARGLTRGFRPVLGVMLEAVEGGTRVARLMEDTPAAKAGLRVGDVIVSIQGHPVRDRVDVVRELDAAGFGEKVVVRYRRGEEEAETTVELQRHPAGARRSPGAPQDAMGAARSSRRDDFRRVLQHDGDLRPEECGSPLVDLRGRVVGINIARAGRTRSYAIPATAVKEAARAWLKAPQETLVDAAELEAALTRAQVAAYSAYRAREDARREVEDLEASLERARAAVEQHTRRIREAEDAVDAAARRLEQSRTRKEL